MAGYRVHEYDVLVVGAGGAGLRAAIAAAQEGARTAIVCKTLLGKAHTVMAEGGVAAALATVDSEDNWRVHFRDTMRGGKLINDWRMAMIHAQEAPDRVLELEEWGAVFDRTADGRILQRPFGGHRYARLAHVGDRTGLELVRTLQQKALSLGIDVFMETSIVRILKDSQRVAGALGFRRDTGELLVFRAKAVVLATGGIGKCYKVTSNSWEYTGDGQALAFWAGAELMDMEFVQFHPTGMVWPPSVRGVLVTEAVRGEGGVLLNSRGERFMFHYIPDYYRAETAETPQEADRWYHDKRNNRRPPELLPRDVVARAINAEIKAGRGSPHGGVYLDIASRRSPKEIKHLLPSMYEQFAKLADVDITKEPMEVGPTMHYMMGGIRVDPETAATSVPGLYAAGEVACGLHGANRLGGNSLSDLLVFGRRAGIYAARYANSLPQAPTFSGDEVETAANELIEPLHRADGENPFALQAELQETMQNLVGIVRTGDELKEALHKIQELKDRTKRVAAVGDVIYNPGWHMAISLGPLLVVAEAIALSALERRESRGAHTRDDYPKEDPHQASFNLVVSADLQGRPQLRKEPRPEMPQELKKILEEV